MSKHTDISQLIRKYLNGELDTRAMHSFERQAQDDPFIMDALDGYTKAGASQQANLAELNSRLQGITRPTGTTVINWRYISAAASVVVLLTVGIWFANNQPEKEEKKLALQEKILPVIPKEELPVGDSAATTIIEGSDAVVQVKPDNKVRVEANKAVTVAKPAAPESEVAPSAIAGQQNAADTTSLEEMIALNYDQKQQDKKAYVAAPADNESSALQGRQQGVLAQQESVKKDKASASEIKASNNISGQIMDAAGPIPGARVTVKGTPITAVTDLNGKFTLPVPPKRIVLDVNVIGYLNKQVKVNQAKDSLFIDMKPAQAINGIITGYGAGPCCWDVYEKYLKDNAISPDGKIGTVKLTFTVNPDNSLTDFNIIKGLSEQTDQKAIELIKNGPVWLHDSSGKPKKVTLRIKFAAKQ